MIFCLLFSARKEIFLMISTDSNELESASSLTRRVRSQRLAANQYFAPASLDEMNCASFHLAINRARVCH